jgi:hypothetical protein
MAACLTGRSSLLFRKYVQFAYFQPSTQTWATNVARTFFGLNRTYGNSVLLPLLPKNNYAARVMILGGFSPTPRLPRGSSIFPKHPSLGCASGFCGESPEKNIEPRTRGPWTWPPKRSMQVSAGQKVGIGINRCSITVLKSTWWNG